jgi:hypothetical protein
MGRTYAEADEEANRLSEVQESTTDLADAT